MKKLIAYILSIIFVFSLADCSGSTDTPSGSVGPDKPIAAYIGDDVTEVKIRKSWRRTRHRWQELESRVLRRQKGRRKCCNGLKFYNNPFTSVWFSKKF